MSDQTHDACELQINASAWVLGALDESDVADYAAHVDGCTVCRAEIAQLQMVTDALPLASEQIAPPPALADRIMAVVSSEAQLLRAAGPQADRPPERAAGMKRSGWLSGWRLAGVGLAALAVGIVVGTSLSGGGSERHVTQAQVTLSGAHATLVVQGTRARLEMTGMPNPPSGKVYEVWIQHGAAKQPTPTDALFTVRASGHGDVTVPDPVHAGDHVLVTAERSGGSDVPTSAPVITAQA
jgi:anti-sigma-K factor RskA